jgi:DNA-directed RNA polymerase subunit RPC12/RpoP
MFFPCLSNLKKAKFPEKSIEIFDWWLGTRRANTLKTINPIQFSIDCDISLEHTLQLFSAGVYRFDIKLMKPRYITNCPVCSHKIIDNYSKPNTIELTCSECGFKLNENIIRESTEIYFVLLKQPLQLDPDSSMRDFYKKEIELPKKANSLRISDIEKSSSSDVRRLKTDLFDLIK